MDGSTPQDFSVAQDLDIDELLEGIFEIPTRKPRVLSNAETALGLARRDFAVFPITCKTDGSWTPIRGWQAAASRDPEEVARLWRQHSDARVGLPCGEINGISVIDVDVKDGKDGIASLRALGFDPDRMSPYRVRTPSGGLHLFFQFHPRLKNWVGKLGEGLDVRTTGGYVLAPGSLKAEGRYERTREKPRRHDPDARLP